MNLCHSKLRQTLDALAHSILLVMLNRHALFVRCGRQLLRLLWWCLWLRGLLVAANLCSSVTIYLGFGCFLLLCFHLCVRPRRLSAGFRRHDRRERLFALLVIQRSVVDVHLCPAWVSHRCWCMRRITVHRLYAFGVWYDAPTEVQRCALFFYA